jgi:predicted transcriptional regulator
MTIRESLRERRQKLGLSQSELARSSGVSRFKLNDFEAGGKSLTADETQRIERALQNRATVLRQHLFAVESLAS